MSALIGRFGTGMPSAFVVAAEAAVRTRRRPADATGRCVSDAGAETAGGRGGCGVARRLENGTTDRARFVGETEEAVTNAA
ncbi:hypothetical protein [Streptosporangium canum]|uniref:hypothetical protein n=1 Tax=Streptosporangium canum TaxID=324952 RepID=UPI0037B062EA